MSDNYEFAKSVMPQGIETETPYLSKQWNYINDINNGVYSNNGLSLVQFDMSSIYNSSALIDISQAYLAIPISYVSAYSTASALVAPVAGSWASTGLKSGYFQLIHGLDLSVGGKQLEQFVPNVNQYVQFKMLSQMSHDDLKTIGTTIGMGDDIDNPQSLRFAGSAIAQATGTSPTLTFVSGSVGGNGVSNNLPFSASPDFGDQPALGSQFTNAYNNGYYSRLRKIIDTTNSNNKLFGSASGTSTEFITNATKTSLESKAYYTVNNTNYATWYDVAIIRLCDVLDSMKSLPLMKKFDGVLRFYVNTGTVVSSITGTSGQMITSGSQNTFTNTCPLIQSALLSLPASATNIGSGLFIGTPTATSLTLNSSVTGVNLASGTNSHFLNACRIYYPQVQLKPEKLIPYISENRAKKVCWTSVLNNTFANISAGATVSFLVQSGVTAPRGLLVLPYVSGATHGSITTNGSTANTSVVPFSQLLSPFSDGLTAPISLINLQVSIGGVNVLQNVLTEGWNDFLQQVNLYEKLAGSDLGLTCGLINQEFWETYRMYYVDCSRASIPDMASPRNITLSFTNNSLQAIDVLVFTEYFREGVVDVETGIISA